MKALGIDIIEVERIRFLVNRFGDRFMRKVFTDAEIADCMAKARPSESFAARFAAKEAFAKVWPGAPLPQWRDVEVVKVGPRPEFRFHGIARGTVAGLSLSHTHGYAAAVVWLVEAPSSAGGIDTAESPDPGASSAPRRPPSGTTPAGGGAPSGSR
jgi:holo-[acyl-carrier protein] synthase